MPERLFYVVGASGAGKDSIIRYARETLQAGREVVFAHRYITRPADVGGENHVALSEAEFLLRERHGLFAMSWESHSRRYGIGLEVDAWLGKGLTVVINGSRGYVPRLRARYPDCAVVWISAAPEAIAARLHGRARESCEEISARLERNARLGVEPPAQGVVHIANDGPLEDAGGRLVDLLAAR